MRFFLAIFAVVIIVGCLVAGKRGDTSRKPPIEVFPDMDRQLKLRPQTPNGFFANGLSSQAYPEGAVAQSRPLLVTGKEIYPFEDHPVITGTQPGTTNFVVLNPLPFTSRLLARGHERFNIYCAPCHGQQGDGNGIVKKVVAAAVIGNLHDKRMVEMPDGELFSVVSKGKGLMQGYAAQIPVEDRWAVIAYVRALQLSRLGDVSDLSPELAAKLKK
jgi:Cytochrome C oxidase, cbb3-type, subunit III